MLEAEAEALVNTVNCVGFMGKGIALQFKQAFPENFDAYRRACEQSQLHPDFPPARATVFNRAQQMEPRDSCEMHDLPLLVMTRIAELKDHGRGTEAKAPAPPTRRTGIPAWNSDTALG